MQKIKVATNDVLMPIGKKFNNSFGVTLYERPNVESLHCHFKARELNGIVVDNAVQDEVINEALWILIRQEYGRLYYLMKDIALILFSRT